MYSVIKKCISFRMRIEIPIFKRCCFCLPLINGILIFGYLNLLLSILILSLTSWVTYEESSSTTIFGIYKGVNFYTQFWFPVTLLSFDLIFNVILIVGVHINKTSMIRVYYYYGVMTTFAAFMIYLVTRVDTWNDAFPKHLMDSTIAFTGLVIQVYLLLLIRSELDKRKENNQVRYVNHLAEFTGDPVLGGGGQNPL